MTKIDFEIFLLGNKDQFTNQYGTGRINSPEPPHH